MHGALADLTDHLLDLVSLDALGGKPARAIDVGVRHGPAGIGLERERLGHPALAEIARDRVVVTLGGVGEAMEEAVHTLEHRAGTNKARAPEQGRTQARLRGPARVKPLGPGTLG